jgi:hypothetical protein
MFRRATSESRSPCRLSCRPSLPASTRRCTRPSRAAMPGDQLPDGWELHIAGPVEQGWARDHGVGVARGLRPVSRGEAPSGDPRGRRRGRPAAGGTGSQPGPQADHRLIRPDHGPSVVPSRDHGQEHGTRVLLVDEFESGAGSRSGGSRTPPSRPSREPATVAKASHPEKAAALQQTKSAPSWATLLVEAVGVYARIAADSGVPSGCRANACSASTS